MNGMQSMTRFGVIFCGSLSFLMEWVLGSASAQIPLPEVTQLPSVAQQSIPLAQELEEFTPEERRAIQVYEQTNRSVVNISTRSVPRDITALFDQVVEGAGSGAILDQRGHILTNHHVIAEFEEIRVTLFNGQSFEAKVVGSDPPNDIAILKIEAPAEQLLPITVGESSRLRVGQKVYAIGNPFGLERTMTEGIISSLNRTLPVRGTERTMKSIIQVDAALNRGNSGGPLLNSRGEVIGMNTAIASSVGESSGVGFAIPANTIRRVVPQLIEQGRVVRATLGIERTWTAPEGLAIAVLVITLIAAAEVMRAHGRESAAEIGHRLPIIRARAQARVAAAARRRPSSSPQPRKSSICRSSNPTSRSSASLQWSRTPRA